MVTVSFGDTQNLQTKTIKLEELLYIVVSNLSSISKLIFSNSNLTKEDFAFICPLIPAKLKELSMENLGINASSINQFSKKMINHRIQFLNLSHNPIGDESVWMLLDFIKKNTELTSISLRNCGLTAQGIWPLLNVIATRNFEFVDISENEVRSAGADYIAQFLEMDPIIESFFVDNSQLSSGDVEMLFKRVERCKNISKFSMIGNSVIAWRENPKKINVDMMKQMK